MTNPELTAAAAVAAIPPGRTQRRAAMAFAVASFLVAAFAVPFGDVPLPPAPAFLPGFGALSLLGNLLTAAILIRQARHDHAAAALGAAYLFAAIMLAAYLLAFPGALTAQPLIGQPGSAFWLWTLWHGGFALLVAGYAISASLPSASTPAPVRSGKLLATVAVAAIGCILLVVWGGPYLPTMLVGQEFTRFNTIGIGPAVVALNVLALVLVTVRLRQHLLAIWLTVAMQAAVLEAVLTLLDAERFTLGWYIARGFGVASGLVVLLALLAQLLKLVERISAANAHLETLSRTDPLTRIPNRRAFDTALANEWRRARRNGAPLAILAIDVDRFKSFNDRYGHPAGDECLRRVARAIASAPGRAGDMPARIGGEEFAVLLPGCDTAAGAQVAAAIHDAVASIGLHHTDNPLGRVTISVGIAAGIPARGTPPTTLAAAADRALYVAKTTGRNQTCLADPTVPLTPARPADTPLAEPLPSPATLRFAPQLEATQQ